jgi:hypothetical protein
VRIDSPEVAKALERIARSPDGQLLIEFLRRDYNAAIAQLLTAAPDKIGRCQGAAATFSDIIDVLERAHTYPHPRK